jgi:hypothetical protein
MIVTAWNNGAHSRNGAGYGLRVNPQDRDAFFKKEWDKVILEIEDQGTTAEAHFDIDKFWSEIGAPILCREVGLWLRHHGLAPWALGNPPVFVVDPIEGNRFIVKLSGPVKTGRRRV